MGLDANGDNTFFYEKGMKIKKGDILLVTFGEDLPSVFKVLKSSYKTKTILVTTIVDHYKGSDGAWDTGKERDIGKMIFEGYWAFRRMTQRMY